MAKPVGIGDVYHVTRRHIAIAFAVFSDDSIRDLCRKLVIDDAVDNAQPFIRTRFDVRFVVRWQASDAVRLQVLQTWEACLVFSQQDKKVPIDIERLGFDLYVAPE